MTADDHSIDLAQVMSEHLERAEPDLLRSLLKLFVETLMGADADAVCGAPYGTRSPERTNSRNGYRARDWTPAPARSSWRCPSCAPAPTSPSGCWNVVGVPSGR